MINTLQRYILIYDIHILAPIRFCSDCHILAENVSCEDEASSITLTVQELCDTHHIIQCETIVL